MASGQFHSALYANFPGPGQATPNDVWFAVDQGLTYWTDNQGNLHQLLAQSPFNVSGGQGPAGPAGSPGKDFSGQVGFFGTWEPLVPYSVGSVVTFNGTMFMAIVDLTINDNQQNPAVCPAAWVILGPVNSQRTTGLVFFCDGAGSVVPTGPRGVVSIPFDDCTLTGYSLISDVAGDCVLDILWSPFSGYPASLTSIVGSNNPTLNNAQKSEVLDVSGLFSKTSFSEGDILQLVVSSASTLTQISLTLNLNSQN